MPSIAGYAGASANEAFGGTAWTDEPEAIGAPDATTADAAVTSPHVSDFLACSTFGLLVPGGATIGQLTVTIRARASRSVSTSLDSNLRVRVRLPSGTYAPEIGLLAIPSDNVLRDYEVTGSGPSSVRFGLAASELPESVIEHNDLAVVIFQQNVLSGVQTVGVDAVTLTADYTPTVTFDAAQMVPDDRLQIEWPPPKKFRFSC